MKRLSSNSNMVFSMNKKGIIKAIDANLNRALEGVRVIEDISRFILSNKKITQELKYVRHNIAKGTKQMFPDRIVLLGCRDTKRDVGAFIKCEHELKRTGSKDILESNFRRASEALRVLEEFGKLFDVKASILFKKMRFEVYRIEKDMFINGKLKNMK